MLRTSLAILDSESLLEFEAARPVRSEMEIELAQRLQLALDYISDLEAVARAAEIGAQLGSNFV